MSALKISLKKNAKSYVYAYKGILHTMLFENNFKYQAFAAILVTALGYIFEINKVEWIIVVITIGLVFTAELFNTAIEKLCDHLHPDQHPAIGLVKDVSAGAVLITAISASIVGLIIFLPKVL